jgi:hypothetical protein
MPYICITKTEEGFCAVKMLIRFFANGKPYEITKEGDNGYFITTVGNKKVKLKGFTINTDLVVAVTESEQIDGWVCISVDEINQQK